MGEILRNCTNMVQMPLSPRQPTHQMAMTSKSRPSIQPTMHYAYVKICSLLCNFNDHAQWLVVWIDCWSLKWLIENNKVDQSKFFYYVINVLIGSRDIYQSFQYVIYVIKDKRYCSCSDCQNRSLDRARIFREEIILVTCTNQRSRSYRSWMMSCWKGESGPIRKVFGKNTLPIGSLFCNFIWRVQWLSISASTHQRKDRIWIDICGPIKTR